MGKPPLTDEERRIKDLTREMHEATQAALDAARQLREARDGLGSTIDAIVVAHVNSHVREINGYLDQGYELMLEVEKTVQAAIGEVSGRVLGFADYETALDHVAEIVKNVVVSPEYQGSIARRVVEEMNELLRDQGFADESKAFAIREVMARRAQVTVMDAATAGRPPGLYDEHMQPLNFRIVP